MSTSEFILIIALAYGLGSIPFGVLLARYFKLPDPRTIGSGNIGATNMMRTGRKDVALLTLLLDGGKGALAVAMAGMLAPDDATAHALAGAAAAFGHMVSVWLTFKGGKGMATILGATLAVSWPCGLVLMGVWLVMFILTRYVALASLTALSLAPLVLWLRIDAATAVILGCAAGLAIWRHRENMRRLRAGTEPRVQFRGNKDGAA